MVSCSVVLSVNVRVIASLGFCALRVRLRTAPGRVAFPVAPQFAVSAAQPRNGPLSGLTLLSRSASLALQHRGELSKAQRRAGGYPRAAGTGGNLRRTGPVRPYRLALNVSTAEDTR
jgi:hypothetical protein